MLEAKVKKLDELKKQVTLLEQEVAKTRVEELARLHLAFGFSGPAEFLKAYKAAVEKAPAKARKPAAPAAAAGGARKRKGRVRLTAETKEQMKSDLRGGMQGTEVARKYGVSLPTVQSLKKTLGLVKARSAAAAPVEPAPAAPAAPSA